MSHKYFKIALRLTRNSTHSKHKMAALIVRGGAILSQAANKHTWGEHAEKRALTLKRANKPEGATMYIAREGHKMSKPCNNCMKMIKSFRIKNIVFANWSKKLESLIVGE